MCVSITRLCGEGLVDWEGGVSSQQVAVIVGRAHTVVSYIHVLCSDITADTRSEEVGEGQMGQERVQGIISAEDKEDSIDSHTHTTTGILSHSICLLPPEIWSSFMRFYV